MSLKEFLLSAGSSHREAEVQPTPRGFPVKFSALSSQLGLASSPIWAELGPAPDSLTQVTRPPFTPGPLEPLRCELWPAFPPDGAPWCSRCGTVSAQHSVCVRVCLCVTSVCV